MNHAAPGILQEIASKSLLDLPDEILQLIAVLLDIDSLIALSQVNLRLQQISRASLTSVKLEDEISATVLKFLEVNGALVRRLDISNYDNARWNVPHDLAESAIVKCYLVTDLNLINTDIEDWNALSRLENLETLRINLNDYFASLWKDGLISSFAFLKSIKKLHIETLPLRAEYCISLVNSCLAVEVLYIDVYGRDIAELGDHIALLAERWKTLHTVVVAGHQADTISVKNLLEKIFTHNFNSEIRSWIQTDRECYIYEHGFVNGGISTAGVPANYHLELLKRFDVLTLSDHRNSVEVLKSAWGPPRSVRVTNSSLPELHKYFSTALTELDIRECHGNFSAEVGLDLLASLPSLRSMLIPVCFFLPLETAENSEVGNESLCRREGFRQAWQKLRLKKLSVFGVRHESICVGMCHNFTESNCYKCSDTSPLTSEDLIEMRGFEHLEEFNLIGVNLASSAYDNIASPNLRTARFRLNANNDFSGLRRFLRGSDHLRYLKLEALDLPSLSEALWEALVEGRELKQLCLRTKLYKTPQPLLEHPMPANFRRVLKQVDYLHVHGVGEKLGHPLVKYLFDRETPEYGISRRKLLVVYEKASYEELGFHPCFIFHSARGLCYTDASVGPASPLNWDAR